MTCAFAKFPHVFSSSGSLPGTARNKVELPFRALGGFAAWPTKKLRKTVHADPGENPDRIGPSAFR